MKTITVAAAVLNQTPLDWIGNQKRIRTAIQEAREKGAQILCLPELCITGYGCEDAFHSIGLQQKALEILKELVPETKEMVVCFGLPILFQNALFNVVCLVANGKVLGFVAKRYLAGDGIHYEPRWFKPWPAGVRNTFSWEGVDYPIGDFLFECGGIKIGFEICEDAWVASRPGSSLALQGVDFILNPSASHFAFGKIRTRERFVIEGSRAFNVSYLYSNLLGNEAGRAIYDGGALIASAGKILGEGPRFSFEDVVVTVATVDVDATRINQARTASYRPQITSEQGNLVRAAFDWKQNGFSPTKEIWLADWEKSLDLKKEEFTRAVALGLFDYLRKSHSHGFVVSLSGGADSAAVSCLIHLMLKLAEQDFGWEKLIQKIAYIPNLPQKPDIQALTKRLLTCVYQGSHNSTETTRHAAQTLAEALGAEYFEFEIGGLVDQYTQMVEKALGRELEWKKDDLALQNIQARVRSPGIWMMANLRNALLLSTSNRSEAAVGYATMDGDTSGGLSPVAGIDKAFLREWLTWLEKEGPRDLAPIAALHVVNTQKPTAELRPETSKQSDEEDLMPYPLLNAIEQAAIRDKQMPLEVFHRIRSDFPQYSFQQIKVWVERFFKLWCRNQWKRERYAPSFHLDDENLDPKSWCRFPILSGGFENELEVLRAFPEDTLHG